MWSLVTKFYRKMLYAGIFFYLAGAVVEILFGPASPRMVMMSFGSGEIVIMFMAHIFQAPSPVMRGKSVYAVGFLPSNPARFG